MPVRITLTGGIAFWQGRRGDAWDQGARAPRGGRGGGRGAWPRGDHGGRHRAQYMDAEYEGYHGGYQPQQQMVHPRVQEAREAAAVILQHNPYAHLPGMDLTRPERTLVSYDDL